MGCLPTVLEFQCAWQLLLQSADPRAKPHHAHVAAISLQSVMRFTMKVCQAVDGHRQCDRSRVPAVGVPPMFMGGLGLRSGTEQGFWWCPTWTELAGQTARFKRRLAAGSIGRLPSVNPLDNHADQPPSRRAHLRSDSGHNAGVGFDGTRVHDFRVMLLERLALPLPITSAVCEGSQDFFDPWERHLAACTEASHTH